MKAGSPGKKKIVYINIYKTITVKLVNLAWFFNLAFLANVHQREIKDRIKIFLHKDGVVLTAPDAKINTGKILF